MVPIPKRLRFRGSLSKLTSTGPQATTHGLAYLRQKAWKFVVLRSDVRPTTKTTTTSPLDEIRNRGWRPQSPTTPSWTGRAFRSSRSGRVSAPDAYALAVERMATNQRQAGRSEVYLDRRARVGWAGSRSSRWRSGTWGSGRVRCSSREQVDSVRLGVKRTRCER